MKKKLNTEQVHVFCLKNLFVKYKGEERKQVFTAGKLYETTTHWSTIYEDDNNFCCVEYDGCEPDDDFILDEWMMYFIPIEGEINLREPKIYLKEWATNNHLDVRVNKLKKLDII